MAIKQTDPEEEEFQEIIEAFWESCEELLEDADEDADSERVFYTFWTDKNREPVHIRCSNGDCGSISWAEFWEIKKQIGRECLICAGPLKFFFKSKSRPALYLVCDQCETAHRIASGELCLFAI